VPVGILPNILDLICIKMEVVILKVKSEFQAPPLLVKGQAADMGSVHEGFCRYVPGSMHPWP
jgi:hypothetical protein